MGNDVIVIDPELAKPFRCPKCKYRASRNYNLQRHMVKHREKPPKEMQHICTYANCNFATLRWDNLCRHIRRHHRPTKTRTPPPDEAKTEKPTTPIPEDVAEELVDVVEMDLDALLYEDIQVEQQVTIEPPPPEPTPTEHAPPEPEPPEPTKEPPVVIESSERKKKPVPKNQKVTKPRRTYKSGKYKYYECITCNYRTNRTYNVKRHLAKHVAEKTKSDTEIELHVCVIAGCGFSTPRWDNLCRHVNRVHPEQTKK